MNQKSHEPAVYDQNLATQIAGGNPRIAAELLILLLKDLPSQKEALQNACAAGDWQTLRQLNHKLHGSARYCGTPALIDTTRDLANTLPGDAVPEVVARACDAVLTEINRLLALNPALLYPSG